MGSFKLVRAAQIFRRKRARAFCAYLFSCQYAVAQRIGQFFHRLEHLWCRSQVRRPHSRVGIVRGDRFWRPDFCRNICPTYRCSADGSDFVVRRSGRR